jgi:hypothetical protein
MADKYITHAPGYDPTDDQIPPPRDSAAGAIGCGCLSLVVILLGVLGVFLFFNNRQQGELAATQTAIALTPTATQTVDAWAATGTAIFWLTFTPTPTPIMTATATSTGTVTPDVPASVTALFLTMVSPTPTPSITPTYPGSQYYSGGNNRESGQTVVVTRIVERPEVRYEEVEVTRQTQVIVPIVVTATLTPFFPTAESTEVVIPSLTPSFTPTWTASPTLTETPTPTWTPTSTETPSFTPTWTASPTLTETPTPTWTPTLTETPTETPTEAT